MLDRCRGPWRAMYVQPHQYGLMSGRLTLVVRALAVGGKDGVEGATGVIHAMSNSCGELCGEASCSYSCSLLLAGML